MQYKCLDLLILSCPEGLFTYGTKCVGRIMTKSMSYFLHLCDCSQPDWTTLEAWNWFVAGQHLNASHPTSPVWPNQNVTLFSGNNFFFFLLLTVSTPQPIYILT
jgi:hypothetical protein